MRHRLTPVPLFLALLVSPLVLTWLPATAAQDASGERVLRIEKSDYPDTLDPQLAYDTSQDMIIGLGFEGLTRINDELNTVPAAAESWEFSPDGLILTFHLRDGLTYSDGTPLTAERFRYAIARTCDPQLDSFNSSLLFVIAGCEAFFTSLDAIEDGEAGTPGAADATAADAYETARANVGVRAVDDQTLELRLSRPAVYVPALASMAMFFPAKQELIEGRGEEWWRDSANLVGNGPFVIAELGNDTDRPSRLVFTANEHYWAGRPTLDRIEYVMANVDQTAEERLDAYRRGEVDMVWLGYDALAAVEADPELARDLVQLPRAATIHLALNVHKEPFTDPKVREAFAFGFDRAGFCRQIQHDFCEPTLSWIAPGTPGYVPTDAYAFDPQKAREALAASTYGGPETLPQVTWYYSADAGAEGLGSQMGAKWLAAQYRGVLGIELSLVAVADADWDPLFADPVAALQWSEQGWFQAYPDPKYWLSEVWTCRSGYNLFGYCNPDLDALLAQADAEPDPETRLALYQEAERLLIADVPSIFLFNWATALLVKPAVTNYASTAIDHWPGWTTPLTIDVVRST